MVVVLLFFAFWLWFMCYWHKSTGVIKGRYSDNEKLGPKNVRSVSKELALIL